MTAAPQFHARQRELFAQRTAQIVARVLAGDLGFIEGVDMAYSAAVWSGPIDSIGDDAVQQVMAGAFIGVRPTNAGVI